jgi:hypothetical protein
VYEFLYRNVWFILVTVWSRLVTLSRARSRTTDGGATDDDDDDDGRTAMTTTTTTAAAAAVTRASTARGSSAGARTAATRRARGWRTAARASASGEAKFRVRCVRTRREGGVGEVDARGTVQRRARAGVESARGVGRGRLMHDDDDVLALKFFRAETNERGRREACVSIDVERRERMDD